VVLGVMTLVGCGRPGTSSTENESAGSVTVQAGNGKITIPARPRRIVSLSPTATEMLFAIGAGSQVVAVDDQSTYPGEAPKTKLSGFKPNSEAVIKYNPDLVVLASDMGGIVKALEKVKVPVLLEPSATRLDDSYDQIADLGTATGHAGEAARVTADMRVRIAGAVQAAAPQGKGLTYYHELDDGLHSATSNTFIGQVYGLFGLQNVADRADKQGSGYPQLSPEYLVKADPDLIFLGDTKCCGQTVSTVAKRPGWRDLTAVRDQAVIPLDDDVASRWGPRLVEHVKAVGAAVQKAGRKDPGRPAAGQKTPARQ
jgi:iron complex transport system substrate-binding protein